MNARKTASLALKLMGTYILVQHIGLIAVVEGNIRRGIESRGGQMDLVSILMSLAILGTPLLSIVIIWKSNRIARWMVPEEQAAISTNANASSIQSIAFSAIGLLLAAQAIPGVASAAAQYLSYRHMAFQGQVPGLGMIYHNLYVQLAATVTKFVMGVVLFLQADGLVKLWKRLRETKGVKSA